MKTWTLYYRKVREIDRGDLTASSVCLNIFRWPNRHLFILFWAFLNLFLASPRLSNAQIAVPKLETRVNDLTGTLTSQQKAQLENQLSEFEQKKGSQIGVLIIPSTEGEAIEAFGIRVAEAWKLGRKGIDDGALLIIAKNDRRLRIEVGYGLEGVLNDATCKRIISEIITPHFKSGDYFHGILNGISTMIRLVDGEVLPEVQATHGSSGIEALIVPGIFIVLILSTVLKSALGDIQAAGIMSGLSFFVLIFAAVGLFVALFVALIVFVFVFFSEINGSGISNSSRSGGGFFGGGGSFGGGGFSGGGGSFGGGGASGSW